MEKHNVLYGMLSIAILSIIVVVGSMFLFTSVYAEDDNTCLSCHSNPDLIMTFPDGETLPLYIPQEMLDRSIHNSLGLECKACHQEITGYPHPEIEFNNPREFSRTYYLTCKTCHATNYEKSLDSIHAQIAQSGNLNAPVCTDCHGSHDIQAIGETHTDILEICGKCHTSIMTDYKASVHGGALLSEGNPDVPVCTDCHGVHNIQDPRTAQFRVETPELCAGCHANKDLMNKYGLSSDVYSLYQLSWHGVDISVYKAQWPTIWHESAVCTDCHGVHDIKPTNDSTSKVNPANLLGTCQKCHPTAGPNWVDAWTGHNQISFERTPILFYVNSFYQSFIPYVLWISVGYVLLQIIRSTVDRVKRSLR